MAEKTEREKAQKVIADNRKALHDYHVLDTWEAGVALLGTEVKSIREGGVNLRDSYARIRERRGLADERAHQPLQSHRLHAT
jgi:SsrA-binding protein